MIMNIATQPANQITLQPTQVSSPEELAQLQIQREQFQRNLDWLREHASEVYPKCRGQHICIAGQELFAASTAEQALVLAKAAHPDDAGVYLRYIPRKKADRIYAH